MSVQPVTMTFLQVLAWQIISGSLLHKNICSEAGKKPVFTRMSYYGSYHISYGYHTCQTVPLNHIKETQIVENSHQKSVNLVAQLEMALIVLDSN